MAARILAIEDDTALVTLLDYNLEAEGYEVSTAPSAEDGKLLLAEESFDLIILDWMLPDMSGIELCAELRRNGKTPSIPILMLTARGEEADRVRGLSTGADDYVVKPFSVPELMARVKALLRRSAPERISDMLSFGDIAMDRIMHRVTRGARAVDLGPTEYRLLYHLVQNAGWVVTHDQLLVKVWGYEYRDEPHYVRLYINYLRQKLEKDPR